MFYETSKVDFIFAEKNKTFFFFVVVVLVCWIRCRLCCWWWQQQRRRWRDDDDDTDAARRVLTHSFPLLLLLLLLYIYLFFFFFWPPISLFFAFTKLLPLWGMLQHLRIKANLFALSCSSKTNERKRRKSKRKLSKKTTWLCFVWVFFSVLLFFLKVYLAIKLVNIRQFLNVLFSEAVFTWIKGSSLFPLLTLQLLCCHRIPFSSSVFFCAMSFRFLGWILSPVHFFNLFVSELFLFCLQSTENYSALNIMLNGLKLKELFNSPEEIRNIYEVLLLLFLSR